MPPKPKPGGGAPPAGVTPSIESHMRNLAPQHSPQPSNYKQDVNMGPSSLGFDTRNAITKQILNILNSQMDQQQKNQQLDLYMEMMTGSAGGFAGTTAFARTMSRMTGRPTSEASSRTNLMAVRTLINGSNLFQSILVSELCPTEYMSHPLATLAIQAKLGPEFERRYAMLATHISMDLFLSDYSMLQEELAELEYKILMEEYTSSSSPAAAPVGALGGEAEDKSKDWSLEESIGFLSNMAFRNANAMGTTVEILAREPKPEDSDEGKDTGFFTAIVDRGKSALGSFWQTLFTTSKDQQPVNNSDISASIGAFLEKSHMT